MARKASKRIPPPTATKRDPTKKSPHNKAVPKTKTGKLITKLGAKITGKALNAATVDLNAFPPESLTKETRGLCLACALDVLTRHMGLSAARAQSEIRRHRPSSEELSTPAATRPYIPWPTDKCPYCGAATKWHAPLHLVRIEGGKTTDAPRRVLIKNIEKSPHFTVIEEKSTERDALYDWLAKTGASLDLDSTGWLLEAAQHWLGRRLPKEDWTDIFKQIRFVRRSRRLEQGFQVEGPRLFLAPALFDEALLIQYLLSRSSKAGGQTFEGRLTLRDLFLRLRGGGYLRKMGITARDPSEALEQLVEIYGGEGRVKFYYIVDRRDLLARLASLKGARLPRPKQ
jgi:hypothetical protein